MILLDGAITEILIHRDCSYAEIAGDAAIALIEGNKSGPRINLRPIRRDRRQRAVHSS
jgi:hypothetical protein